MDNTMRLRVGVIGLGRRWRRYRAALANLRDHLEVRAVCDQVAHRAEAEARQLHCVAAAGPVDLLERGDIEAVLLLGEQWYGLWPLEQACRLNKPVFCALGPESDEAHAAALQAQIKASGLPVMIALPTVLAPATRLLRPLLAQRLGAPRLVRAERVLAASPAGPSMDVLRSSAVLSLLAGCAFLLGDAPRSVWTVAGEDPAFATLVLEFEEARLAQLTLWSGPAVRSRCQFEVTAEKGTATAELPGRLRWQEADGLHEQRLRLRSPEQSELEHFLVALRSGRSLQPDFAEAFRALTWRRAALRSRTEGQRILLSPPSGD
jgi:predicted dehydrogenase